MWRIEPPTRPLTDGVVTLRMPSVYAGDVTAVMSYCEEEAGHDESWLPLIPHAPAQQSVADWLDGWAGRPSHNGPTLLVTITDAQRFVGIVGFGYRSKGVVEMIYGIAPAWRGRGLASRAVRLAASWALSQPEVDTVELRIDQNLTASQHVAVNAGFKLAGTVSQLVPGTGQSFEDLRYELVKSRTEV